MDGDVLDGRWDYVIIGAGSAGCVLANRLSADPRRRVLLLEAGGPDANPWIHIPVGYLYCMGDPRLDWMFRTEPEAGLNGRALAYPRGKVLGGCSSINGMIYMRGQARDYDGWRQQGLTGWGWDDVLPYFLRSEDHFEGGDAMHGAGGELRVEAQRLSWPVLDAFREACVQAGVPKTDDFNRGDNEGAGYFRVTQRRGRRLNAAQAFLRPAARRPNLHVETGAEARRIVIEGGRAVAVEARLRSGRLARIAAEGEILLCAGAIGSPHLLELSGVGDPDRLAALGIATALARPAVGENLQDHLQIRCVYQLERGETLNTKAASLFGKAMIGLEYALFRSGPMSMAPSQLGVFARSRPGLETPDLEYHVQPLSLERFGEPLDPFPALTASVCALRPESRGSVHAKSPRAGEAPVIRPNYLSTPGDRRTAADAIRLTRRIVSQAALRPYGPSELKPGPEVLGDDELAAAAGDIATTIFHPVGTCRMGADPGAVLDPELRLRGVDGLRVVDASAMPSITSGNTHAPVTMIAEKAADLIRAAAAARPAA